MLIHDLSIQRMRRLQEGYASFYEIRKDDTCKEPMVFEKTNFIIFNIDR